MSDYRTRLQDAIVKAHEAGDTEAAEMLAKEYQQWKPQTNPSSRSYAPTSEEIKQDAKNFIGGIGKGASNIGNTLITGRDALSATFDGDTSYKDVLDQDAARREKSTQGLIDMGVNPDSGLYTMGKFGTEVAGGSGATSILAKGASKLPLFSNAIRTGGFNLGGTTGSLAKDWAIRSAGGGVGGGAATALIDPRETIAGGAIGAITPVAIKGANKAGKLVGKGITKGIGVTTGAGSSAIEEAFKAGKRGATQFWDNLTGATSFEDVVGKAKQGLTNMRIAKNEQYRSGMLDISKDKSVLDFNPISEAMDKVSSMGSYKGVQINKNASDTVDQLVDTVNQWKALNPSEYHTPEGLDALKQSIGDIRDTTQFGTAARKAADDLYNSVKDQITEQAPIYSKVMKDYAKASETITEMEKALSIGKKSGIDTAVRKLQSVTRNNANTNYGNRLEKVAELERSGTVDLMPDLAGQALNSWAPRGMSGAIQKGLLGPSATAGALTNPWSLLGLATYAPLTSPRLMGTAAYRAGQVAKASSTANEAIKRAMGLTDKQGLFNISPSSYIPLSILEARRGPAQTR